MEKSVLKRFIFFKLPAIIYICTIFILSSIPNPPVPAKMNDKLLHIIEYILLILILYRALNNGLLKKINRKVLVPSVIISFIYGIFDEFHQIFIPSRVASFYDFLSNCAGIIIGTALIWLSSYFFKELNAEFA